jgi:hypothetical protein
MPSIKFTPQQPSRLQNSSSSSLPSPTTLSSHISHSASASDLKSIDTPSKRQKLNESTYEQPECATQSRGNQIGRPSLSFGVISPQLTHVSDDQDDTKRTWSKTSDLNRKRPREEQVSDETRATRAILSDLVDETYHMSATGIKRHIDRCAPLRGFADRAGFFFCRVLSYREYMRCNGDASRLIPGSFTPAAYTNSSVEPIFWGAALSQLLHASGDSENPHNLTVWRAEWQLSRFYKDIFNRLKSANTNSSQSLKGGKPWCSLDMLSEALLPDVYAVRLCEFVVRWIKRNRKRNFSSAESGDTNTAVESGEAGTAPDDEDDEAQILDAAELVAEVEPKEDVLKHASETTAKADSPPQLSPISAPVSGPVESDGVSDVWRPSPSLEARLLALAPNITSKTVELDRLKRRHEQASFFEHMDETAYSHFARCIRVSLARQKGKLFQFFQERCNGDRNSFRFPSEVLECLGVLGTEFISRLVCRAKSFPGLTSSALYRDRVASHHIPRYEDGDLLTLNSAPAPLLQD